MFPIEAFGDEVSGEAVLALMNRYYLSQQEVDFRNLGLTFVLGRSREHLLLLLCVCDFCFSWKDFYRHCFATQVWFPKPSLRQCLHSLLVAAKHYQSNGQGLTTERIDGTGGLVAETFTIRHA